MKLKNTSRHSDEFVQHIIRMACEECGFLRLPVNCEVVIVQGTSDWSSGRAWHGYSTKWAKEGDRLRVLRRKAPRGGYVFVRAAKAHRKKIERGGKGGYLPHVAYGSTEDFVYLLAHEVRHVFQGLMPLPRDTRKIRKHTFGTNAKLIEIDASRAGIRVMRRWRREHS